MVNNLGMAMRALLQNRLQTLLTLLGVAVGVAMVVIVSGLGLGAQARIEAQIEAAGPTMIEIKSGNYQPAGIAGSGTQDSSGGEPSEGIGAVAMGDDGEIDPDADTAASANRNRLRRAAQPMRHQAPPSPLRHGDIALLRSQISGVRAIAGVVEGNLTLDRGEQAVAVRIVRASGIDPAWPDMRGWKLSQGRLISDREHAGAAAVMVMAPGVARTLWPDAGSDAAALLGRRLSIGGRTLTLVGLVDGTKDAPDELVQRIYTPLRLAQALLGQDTLDTISVRTTSVAVTTATAQAIKAALRRHHGLADDVLDDFRVQTQSAMAMPSLGADPRLARSVHGNIIGLEAAAWQEMAKSLRAAGRTFTLLLAAAAAEHLGLHAFLGPFVFGVAMMPPADDAEDEAYVALRRFVHGFFAPLYFVSLGLTTDFARHFTWPLVAAVTLVATASKIPAAYAGARFGGLDRRTSWAVGCGMNARGAIGIILANLGLDNRLIDEPTYVALVVMAIVTSLGAGPSMRACLGQGAEPAGAGEAIR